MKKVLLVLLVLLFVLSAAACAKTGETDENAIPPSHPKIAPNTFTDATRDGDKYLVLISFGEPLPSRIKEKEAYSKIFNGFLNEFGLSRSDLSSDLNYTRQIIMYATMQQISDFARSMYVTSIEPWEDMIQENAEETAP